MPSFSHAKLRIIFFFFDPSPPNEYTKNRTGLVKDCIALTISDGDSARFPWFEPEVKSRIVRAPVHLGGEAGRSHDSGDSTTSTRRTTYPLGPAPEKSSMASLTALSRRAP